MGARDPYTPLPEAGAGGSALVRQYEAIAETMQLMRAAAREDDWARVAQQQRRCNELIATARVLAASVKLSGAEERRRFELMRSMLSDDAEVRLLAEPWLHQLQGMLAALPAEPPAAASPE